MADLEADWDEGQGGLVGLGVVSAQVVSFVGQDEARFHQHGYSRFGLDSLLFAFIADLSVS